MTTGPSRRRALATAVDGVETFSEQAGFRLADKPSPLYQLLVLAILVAKPLDAGLAVAGVRELRRAGARTPRAMLGLTWQQRVDALGAAHYRRFDESMATRLGESAQFLLDTYRGDLRRLAAAAEGSTDRARELLTDVPGIGPAGADVVMREAQAVWPWAAPFFDDRVLSGARLVGLPHSARGLRDAAHDADVDPARLAALFVRVTLDDEFAASLRAQLG